MKKLVLFFAVLHSIAFTFGQTMYESPHVSNGKTIQFTIPAGYFEVVEGTYQGGAVYASSENLGMEALEEANVSVLEVSHEALGDNNLMYYKNQLEEEVKDQEGIVVVHAPVISTVNGREVLFAAYREEVGDGYISATVFGDYLVVIMHYVANEDAKKLSYENFKKIITSARVIETDKEDGFEMEEYETDYKNDYFETELAYFDILPEFGEDWDETEEENSHLLSEFCYKGEEGFVRVFSGGNETGYGSVAEMSKSIQKVFDKPANLTLTYSSTLANEDHDFTYYTIAGGDELVGVYTTVVMDELVFLVIEKGSTSSADFMLASKAFIQEMWIEGYE